MRTASEIRASLNPDRQAKIAERTQALVVEEMTLQDLRKAQKLTQEQLAATLKIGQESVSRLEKRSDLLLSTLRTYVHAMGGSLDLVVRFADRAPVSLISLGEISQPTFSSKNLPKKSSQKPELVQSEK